MMIKLKKDSISRQIMLLIVGMILIPVLIICSLISSALISLLHENYYHEMEFSLQTASQACRDSLGGVIDVSLAIISDDAIRSYIMSGPAESDSLHRYNAAESSLVEYCQRNNYISGITIVSTDGGKTLSAGARSRLTEEEKEKLSSSNGAWNWYEQSDGTSAVCRLYRNAEDVQKSRIGFIKITLDTEKMADAILARSGDRPYQYALFDRPGGKMLLITEDSDQSGPEVRDLLKDANKEKRNGNGNVLLKENRRLLMACSQITVNTRPMCFVSYSESMLFYYRMLRLGIIFLLFALVLVFYLFFGVFFRKSIGRPLAELADHMTNGRMQNGAPEHISIQANGEVKSLIDSFNGLVSRLNTLYETNYENELKLRDANLLILQSEMNPHFLYNVLDSIRWMIELGEKKAASGMVQQLSEMFRLTVKISKKSVISLDMELAHLRRYISLERFRFSDKINFTLNIQDNIGNPTVVKFVLQPLVENAIVHGITEAGGYGSIVLTVYKMNHILVYDLRDDGVGADPEKIQKILNRQVRKEDSLEGFALENIQSRLRIRYGNEYGLSYEPRPGGGSIFIVKQPLVYTEGEDSRCSG